jgi:hypothetical protein
MNGRTLSIRWAAASTFRLAAQDGQKPRFRQENAAIISSPHAVQRQRTKPFAWIPQRKNASKSSITYFASGRPSALRSAANVARWS